uniref:Uncharacterized protein n=1 Tax=Kalanchoe fedtschenkoi TaxID=63787 RepID=A0A7N1A715_KALFE
MGFPQKSQVDAAASVSAAETQARVMTEIPLRRSLTRVKTRSAETPTSTDEEGEGSCTTPTSAESRIPVKTRCPAAPMKPKAKARCTKALLGASMEFFTPQDLESVFTIRRRVSN